MVQHGLAGLVEPEDVGMYYWGDPELVKTISFYGSADTLEDAHVDVGLSAACLVSPVNTSKRICSCFEWCDIIFCECIFSLLIFMFPFNGFEEGALRCLKISHSQLHLVARAFVKIFQYWCEYWDKEPALNLFFNLSLCHTPLTILVADMGWSHYVNHLKCLASILKVERISRTASFW